MLSEALGKIKSFRLLKSASKSILSLKVVGLVTQSSKQQILLIFRLAFRI